MTRDAVHIKIWCLLPNYLPKRLKHLDSPRQWREERFLCGPQCGLPALYPRWVLLWEDPEVFFSLPLAMLALCVWSPHSRALWKLQLLEKVFSIAELCWRPFRTKNWAWVYELVWCGSDGKSPLPKGNSKTQSSGEKRKNHQELFFKNAVVLNEYGPIRFYSKKCPCLAR